MNTPTARLNPFRTFPVIAALLFNILVPVLTVAAPAAFGPIGVAAPVSAAGDPSHVSFTLEGCRNPSWDLASHNFICADADYTTGNLGKSWNELDLVPHRLIAEAGGSAPSAQTYTIGITADSMDGGHPGYDIVSVPVLNAAESDASCSFSVSPTGGAGQVITPGVGGTDSSLGRLLTISQNKNTTCVFDWVERLALGSHLFPGSSLHTNRTNSAWSTSGIGAADVSIPVKEIAPQELAKTMSATQGQTYAWSIDKSASPTSLSFGNTCDATAGSRSAQVQITVTWTRSGPTGSGDTTVTTSITATNPAARTITVNLVDKVYSGSTQSDLLDTYTAAPFDVPADSTHTWTHQFVYSGSATSFNDVATATYTDKVTGIEVPGNTTATASATTQPAQGPAANATATITDSESITGNGLSFSVAAPSKGSFSAYTAGTSTTGPVNWSYAASGSGSVTFTKTVTVAAPMITSGTLSDTARVMQGETELANAHLDVPITAAATVSLTITKNIPSDALTGSQTATFTFDITGPGSYSATKTLSFAAGDSTKSVTISGLAPGTYTVHERPLAGWAAQSDQQVNLNLPTCSSTATFTNSPEPDVSVTKTTDTSVVFAGQPVHYQITVSAGGAGTSHDVMLNDTLPSLASGSWSASIASPDNDDSCSITSGKLSCSFGDMASGTSKVVNLTATSAAGDCPGFENTATVSSEDDSNPSNNAAGPVPITVNCPNVSIQKTTTTPVVNAGEQVSYSLTVTAGGTGNSTNVTLTDTLPAGISWVVGGADAGACQVDTGVLTCTWASMAPGASKHVTLTGTAGTGTCPSITNSAGVSSDVDVNPADNAAGPVQITVNCPNVTVLKTADKDPISAGDDAAFTILVTNEGPGTAKSVTLNDLLPADVSWSISPAYSGPGTCSIDSSGTLTCQFGNMNAGATATIHVKGATSATNCGTLTNTATVAATNEAASDQNDNSSTATIDVLCPDLTATKTADQATVNAGQQIGFTITVSNADSEGVGTAHDVALSDPLPAGSGLDWSISPAYSGPGSCSITGSVGSQTLSCSFGDMAPGDSASVRVVSGTSTEDCSTFKNVASVTASNHDELNPEASVTVQCPGLNIAKTAAQSPIDGGAQASFSIVVWNVGSGTALNAKLSDPLPAGDGTLSWSISPAYSGPGSCSITGSAGSQTLSCSFGDLPGGTSMEQPSASITLVATTARADCGTLDNTATVSADNNAPKDASASIDVKCPVIAIAKSNNQPDPVLPGTVVTYSLKVTVSDGPASSVTVVDALPAGLDAPTSISDSGTWDGTARTITWQFASLPNGDKTLTYQATVSAGDTHGQVLRNDVYVTSTNTQCPDSETLAAACQSTSTVTVRVPTLVIAKSASTDEVHFVFHADGSLQSVTPANAQVTWTLTYTLANGPVTNAVISDPLPAYLTFVSAADGGTYDAATRTITWNLGTLTASGSVTFVTTVDQDAPETGPITNVASIVSDQTPESSADASVRVTSEQVEAATSTPKPSVPNTALALGNGQPIQLPIWLLVVLFLGSLGGLALANVRAVRRRR
jgi:uncharacterized repeat protein (TIGR01451 family)/fimbrial isopeptide formation D2 family protein